MKSLLKIAAIVMLSIILQTCKKLSLPDLKTENVSEITQISATSGGEVTNNGGNEVTARGLCWDINQKPTVSSSKTTDGSGNGPFKSKITGLTANTTYYVRAYATNSEGTGYGDELNFTTSALISTVPVAPTIGTANAGNAQATIIFTAPASDGGSAITGYTVTSNPGGITGTGAASPITVTGLTNGTAYTFTVTATNAVGNSLASSATNSVTPSTVPAAPTGISAIAGYLQATVTFSAPGSDGGSAITGYIVTSIPGGFTATGSGSPIIVKGLTNGTTYTFTVVAINSNGNSTPSASSNSVIPAVPSTVVDSDGNIYNTVSIGTQVWLKENLKTTKFKDGTPIPFVTDLNLWSTLQSPAYTWYDNNALNKNIYGGMYNWYAVNTGKLCPGGWHVPSSAEWDILVLTLDPNAQPAIIEQSTIAGGKLKETGTSHWFTPNPSTNESGFTALPGGFLSDFGFSLIGIFGYWHTSTEDSNGTVRTRNLQSDNTGSYNYPNVPKLAGQSVRCVLN